MAYRATTSFMLPSRRFVHAGDLIATGDKDAKFMVKHGLAVDVDDYLVEQATAGPGELRAVKIPKKKKGK